MGLQRKAPHAWVCNARLPLQGSATQGQQVFRFGCCARLAANAHDEASLIMLLNAALMVVGTCFVGLGVFVARDK
eukprot:2478024-Pleurochrysis_carterae.AAC.1